MKLIHVGGGRKEKKKKKKSALTDVMISPSQEFTMLQKQGFGMWRADYHFIATRLPKRRYGFLQGLWGQGGGLLSFSLSVSVLVRIISYIYFFCLCIIPVHHCVLWHGCCQNGCWWHFCNLLLCVTSLEVSSNGTQCKQNKLELKVNTLDCLPVKKSLTAKQQMHLQMLFIHSRWGLVSPVGVPGCSLVAQLLPGAW